MILIDFSSIVHRCIHTSISSIEPKKVDGKYKTSDFIGFTKYLIFQELFNIHREFSSNFGDIVVCLDNHAHGYWRRDNYPYYKVRRKSNRDESEILYDEVFSHINDLTYQIENNLPWKVINVPRAEADDAMLVLSREFNNYEKILIHSPDKDMLQAQRGNDTVFQYSALTKKWMVPENKNDDMAQWIMEHVVLGDVSDDIPKVVDNTEFSKSFLSYLYDEGYNIKSPTEFKEAKIPKEEKIELVNNFDIYKKNRKKESTGIKDIYKDMRFGPATLKKKIKEHGSLDEWLDSHPLYREHYTRNYMLVMAEGIPSKIWNGIVENYKNAATEYNSIEFENYLIENDLRSVIMELSGVFKVQGELSLSDFDW